MSVHRSTQLFKATGLILNSNTDHVTAAITNGTTGRTGAIDISRISNGLLVVNVADAPTGTNPTLTALIDVEDAFGNWVLTSNALGISGSAIGSTGYTYGNISTGYQLTDRARIRWAIGGTGGPSFTGVSLSLYGRP
ncbi:hypothetical protein [Streptomyces sp. H27-C3]|uniref:hypothetical protein n=1 Tax=Streptomyces sp. H27-C3 TaxID=3046305 RepID=UPI0024B9FEE8|nr:hypothetical protein [Streptomyces sp. H27-C3]MDJ0460587.1 hypothetical protein [Streptomyces sp. H27-C3]